MIEGPATAYSGNVTFSVMFYRISGEWNEDPELNTLEYEYKLNTLASKSRVLQGMDILEDNPNYDYQTNAPLYNSILQRLLDLESVYKNDNMLYWIQLGD